MGDRQQIPYGSAVVLEADRDYSYVTHADNEQEVLRLAAGISSRGIVAAITRPFRVGKMTRMVGVEINMIDDTETGFAENPRPLTTSELARSIATVSSIDVTQINQQ